MCGIVGYLGEKHIPKDVVLSGLKRLEYRGYDSAGITAIHEGKLKRVRALGKLGALETKISHENFDGHLGIGHTRWATHGAPSERNAHPHMSQGVGIVHNGIIENYLEIREQLLSQGIHLESETDSELVVHLLVQKIKVTQDLYKAVRAVLGDLKGAFSIVAIWEQQPDLMVGFKDGPPLVVGVGQHEGFIASDTQALLSYTKDFYFLEDREIAIVKRDQISIYNEKGELVHKQVHHIDWPLDQIEKRGFSHFMLKEIHEQPHAVASALEPHLNHKLRAIELMGLDFLKKRRSSSVLLDENYLFEDRKNTLRIFKGIKRISIVACGTSYYAGLVGKYYIEKLASIPVEIDLASEFRYRSPILDKNTLYIFISQSGETADTLAALRLVQSFGASTLGICNVQGSSIDRECDGILYIRAGPEIGVASTKAFTATVSLLAALAVDFAHIHDRLSEVQKIEFFEALVSLPSLVESALVCDKYFDEASRVLSKHKGFLFMGRGVSYPIALEGALKLKELAYLHAEGYAAGEMKHGPLALVDEKMAIVMLAPTDDLFEKTLSNLEEAKARGGRIISIGSGENSKLKQVSERYLPMPKAHWLCNPIVYAVPLQLMAYHLACGLGHDVDKPRNLAKSVTVE